MTEPTPIACTLLPAEMAARADEIRALGRAALRAVELGERSVILRFDPTARPRVERIAAAEARCCAFLDFQLDADAALTIVAPPGAEPVMEELVDLFAAATDVTPSRPWSRSP
jgi:hypothetical protein